MIFGKSSIVNIAEEEWDEEKCLKTMRQSFHRALTTCRAALPPGKKYVAIHFLTKEVIFYVIDIKGKGQEVFKEACNHLGITDAELFGLAFYQDGDYIFIDLNLKVSKYAARSWKTYNSGIGGDGQPLLIFHMRIKHYVDCHLLINEKVARHHYYLQLRENVKYYSQALSEEKFFLLAALALQADLGNYDEEKHKNRYFEISNYFPAWVIAKIGEDFIIRNIPALHKDDAGLSRGEAQVGYIKEASDSTAPHNLHFYKMRRKRGKVWGFVWLGIGDSGIHIYEQPEQEATKTLLSTFLWCDIAKLHFEKKKFEIVSEGSPEYRRFTYFVQNEELAKHLLWMCQTTHHFHMAKQSRVADLKKLELEGGKPYREAYIYTDKFDQALEKRHNVALRSKSKLKLENPAVNFNGAEENSIAEKNMKPVNAKMSGVPWNDVTHLECSKIESQYVPQHHSMEALPLTNGCKFSSDIKYKSQSISCFSDRSLTPCSTPGDDSSSSPAAFWNATSITTTPTSTLMSRNSAASNTDSTCSSLSLTSASTTKANSGLITGCSGDSSRWLRCDSFEELRLKEPEPERTLHKVCISTFVNKHVRTASVYDAVTTTRPNPKLLFTPVTHTVSLNHLPGPTYVSTSSKRTEVKRTPSLDVCSLSGNLMSTPIRPSGCIPYNGNRKLDAQKSSRQYVANAQRTATRIGISSLNRDQRLPLTLYNGRRITACGSEPNLHMPVPSIPDDLTSCPKSQLLERNFNSRSEMCLNVIGSNQHCMNGEASRCESRSRQSSLPDVCNDIVDGEQIDFPFIPPPPAYRNDDESDGEQKDVQQPSFHVPEVKFTANRQPPDVLDIHQLRQKSRDLDLPLISALCNDRSLLMLPKTVPTCSRQRHMGGKDGTRFGRASSFPDGDGSATAIQNGGRPVSWHVDSSYFSDLPGHVPSKPCSASWDNGVTQWHCSPSGTVTGALPSTILTSFGKTPSKQTRGPQDCASADNYRLNKNQMIPTKLLSGSLCGTPNGRLYQKGSSS